MTRAAAKPGAALLGVTHPHTSGRTRALIEKSIPILGAGDDGPVIEPFTKKFEIPERPLEAILDDRDVSIVMIHGKSHSMVPLASSALRAGKAVLVEKPGGKNLEDLETLVRVVEETNGICQVGYSYRFSPIAWASEKTEYTPDLAEIGNLHFFRREVESFVAAALGERPVEIPAAHARDILKLITACYES